MVPQSPKPPIQWPAPWKAGMSIFLLGPARLGRVTENGGVYVFRFCTFPSSHPAVEGIDKETPTWFYLKSWKTKFSSKIQCFGTILHFPAQIDAKFSTDALTFQAASARTHFRGVVMGSNVGFMEIAKKTRKMIKIVENCWKLLEILGNCWKLLEIVRNCWKIDFSFAYF